MEPAPRTRTRNLRLTRTLLYQLSYAGQSQPVVVRAKAAAGIIGALLLVSACGDKPTVVTTIDTLCTVTTRYHATDAQVAAFRADKGLWEPLVDWLLAFAKERDKRCLKPSGTP